MKLAEQCDTAASYIGSIEIGRRFPSLEMIEKMGAALQIQPYLFFLNEQSLAAEQLPNKTKTAILQQFVELTRQIYIPSIL